MDLYISDREALWIIGCILAFYSLAFVLWEVIKAGHRGDFIVQRQLSLGNIFTAVIVGLSVPVAVSFVGAVLCTLIWVLQEPPNNRWDLWAPHSWLSLYAQSALVIQAVLLTFLVCAAVYYIGRTTYRSLLAPIGHGAKRLYRAVRPTVPVRW